MWKLSTYHFPTAFFFFFKPKITIIKFERLVWYSRKGNQVHRVSANVSVSAFLLIKLFNGSQWSGAIFYKVHQLVLCPYLSWPHQKFSILKYCSCKLYLLVFPSFNPRLKFIPKKIGMVRLQYASTNAFWWQGGLILLCL